MGQLKGMRANLRGIFRGRWETARAVLSFGMVALMLLLATFGSQFAPHDPLAVSIGERLRSPGPGHWMGTDELGRDILSRVIAGTRLSLLSALVVLAIGLVVGCLLGAFAGYWGGRTDSVIMRFTDVFLAFPAVLLAMSVSAALGPSLLNAALAIGLVWWPGFARLVRGEFLSLRERTYVEAARALGATDARLIFRHLLPNTYSAVMVKTTVDVGYAIVLAAGLSFVGLGAQPPQPEWGAMVTTGRTFLIGYWWVSTFPGLAILLAVLGFSLAGDTLRDVLDPRWLRT